MNIVYGVQGTGNGHLTRGLALIPKLRSQGHNVRVVISGRKKDTLFGVESLEPFETFEGLSFEVKKGKINYIKSETLANSIDLKKNLENGTEIEFDKIKTKIFINCWEKNI